MGDRPGRLLNVGVPPPLQAAPFTPMASQLDQVIRISRRVAANCWTPDRHLVTIETGSIGFAGAAEDDRHRWLNSFRPLTAGLESPLQIVINVQPGPDDDHEIPGFDPASFEDLRGADISFAEHIRLSSSSRTITTLLITCDKQASRV